MTESNQAFTSVWDALEDTPGEAENMRIRTHLMMAIREFIEARKLSQAEAARLFKVTQPRISELQLGKVDLFSVDRLIKMLAQGGMHVEVSIKDAARALVDSPEEAENLRLRSKLMRVLTKVGRLGFRPQKTWHDSSTLPSRV